MAIAGQPVSDHLDHRLSALIGRFYDAAADGALWAGMAGDVAARRGIGAATVRSHLKAILFKTGAHRQAEAVALIARCIANLDHRT